MAPAQQDLLHRGLVRDQIPEPHPRPAGSETTGLGPSTLFSQALQLSAACSGVTATLRQLCLSDLLFNNNFIERYCTFYPCGKITLFKCTVSFLSIRKPWPLIPRHVLSSPEEIPDPLATPYPLPKVWGPLICFLLSGFTYWCFLGGGY